MIAWWQYSLFIFGYLTLGTYTLKILNSIWKKIILKSFLRVLCFLFFPIVWIGLILFYFTKEIFYWFLWISNSLLGKF